MREPVTVVKLNTDRQETWRYTGEVLRRSPDELLLEAYFNRDDLPFHGITFGRNDRFVEIYYSGRWFNIDEIHDRDDDHLKGWYCNVSRPAEWSDERVAYVDLALDLLVYPDGRQLILDEDEFAALAIDEETRAQARAALKELQQIFAPPVRLRLESQRS
jgi:protein associated with RNAse G/E